MFNTSEMSNTRGKRLMLLGGSRFLVPVIEAAHAMGVHVITCDYLPENIAHRYSDEYCNVSIVDKKAVLDCAAKKRIDGIMSFATDPGVVTASYAAHHLGLPTTGPLDSVSILQNKALFRKFLKDNNFNVPESKSYDEDSKGQALDDFSPLHYPVMVKPVDSAGSKGVSKVTDYGQLKRAIENALKNSICRQFIVEQFLEKEVNSSDSECFSIDGKLVFTSWSSQYFDSKAENPYTPAGFTWPSEIPQNHIKYLEGELQRLVSLLDMGTTIYNVEAVLARDGKAYLMEVSPRGGGNRLAEMVKHATGVDLVAASVRAALGMEPGSLRTRQPNPGWAELIVHSRNSGIFRSVEVNPSISGAVLEKDIWVKPGDRIQGFTGANTSIGTIILRTGDGKQLSEILSHPENYIEVVTSPS